MGDNIVRKGDVGYERLFTKWKESKKDAGWLVIGSEQYRVIAHEDDSIIFIPVAGNIDSMYGSVSGGVSG
jgi:hypothetical protein